MVTIHCNVYEKGDLLRILDYAKEKKREDCNNNPKYTEQELEMDLKKIEILKARVNGKYKEDYLDTTAKVGREKEATRTRKEYQDKDVFVAW